MSVVLTNEDRINERCINERGNYSIRLQEATIVLPLTKLIEKRKGQRSPGVAGAVPASHRCAHSRSILSSNSIREEHSIADAPGRLSAPCHFFRRFCGGSNKGLHINIVALPLHSVPSPSLLFSCVRGGRARL